MNKRKIPDLDLVQNALNMAYPRDVQPQNRVLLQIMPTYIWPPVAFESHNEQVVNQTHPTAAQVTWLTQKNHEPLPLITSNVSNLHEFKYSSYSKLNKASIGAPDWNPRLSLDTHHYKGHCILRSENKDKCKNTRTEPFDSHTQLYFMSGALQVEETDGVCNDTDCTSTCCLDKHSNLKQSVKHAEKLRQATYFNTSRVTDSMNITKESPNDRNDMELDEDSIAIDVDLTSEASDLLLDSPKSCATKQCYRTKMSNTGVVLQNIQGPQQEKTPHHSIHLVSRVLPLSTATCAINIFEQRQGSGDSDHSIAMEISPEDQDVPQLNRYYHLTGVTSSVDNPYKTVSGLIQSLSEYQHPEDIHHLKRVELTGQTSSVSQRPDVVYQKDHRSFETRPARPLTLPIDLESLHRSRKSSPLSFEIYDDDLELANPPHTHLQQSNREFSTPTHMTPVEYSPLKRPDTPRLFDEAVWPSVERDGISKSYIRESIPAYEDRSPSPSPTSRSSDANRTQIGLSLDTEMLDVSDVSHPPQDRTESVSSNNSRTGTMLPPPSPNRSRTCSPQARTPARPYDPASPSRLRSPAIMRVLNEAQSPHRQTKYPFPRRSSSPSIHESICHPVPVAFEAKKIDLDVSTFATSQADTSVTQPRIDIPIIPAPPPIPSDDPAPIKQAKHSARRKSVCQDSGAKVGKNRNATGAAGSGNGKTLAKRNITGMTGKTKEMAKSKLKQRAVTAALTGAKSSTIQDHGFTESRVYDGKADNDLRNVFYTHRADEHPQRDMFTPMESETMDWEDSGFLNDGNDQTQADLHMPEKMEMKTRVRRSARLRLRRDE